jgi:NADPH:quinone reductase
MKHTALFSLGLILPVVAIGDCRQFIEGESMKAIGYMKSLPATHPESLYAVDLPKPTAGAGDLVVQVRAVSVNPVDTKQRKRKEGQNNEPVILGYDAAGVVTEVGSAVTGFQVGDEVYYAGDITRPGTNSQFHAVDARIVGKRPGSLSMAESASVPLTALTAYEALFEHLHLRKDHSNATVLIIGGAGGVGSMAIQMAKLAGARVVTTASRPETVEWVKRLGADVVLDHRNPLKPQLEAHGITEVDAIFNTADTAGYWEQMAALIKPFGHICSIVESKEPLDLTLLMMKSASFSWELMFTRSMFQTPDMARQGEILNEVATWFDQGRLVSTVGKIFEPISGENLREAHALLESGKTVGKVVLTGW